MKKKNTVSDFEGSMRELEEILEAMSDERATLDESIGLYARAAELIKTSRDKLAAAQLRIEEIDAVVSEMEEQDEL